MTRIKVICAIIIKEEKILAVQRSKNMNLPLKWEFPGGKLENNETEKECIIREIKEELNININPIKKLSSSLYSYPNINIELIPYISQYKSGELKLLEHEQFKWLTTNNLINLDWAEADIPIIKEFINLWN